MKTKNKPQIVEAASSVEAAHEKVKQTRSQLKRCRTMFLNSKVANTEAELNFQNAKDAMEQQLIEKN